MSILNMTSNKFPNSGQLSRNYIERRFINEETYKRFITDILNLLRVVAPSNPNTYQEQMDTANDLETVFNGKATELKTLLDKSDAIFQLSDDLNYKTAQKQVEKYNQYIDEFVEKLETELDLRESKDRIKHFILDKVYNYYSDRYEIVDDIFVKDKVLIVKDGAIILLGNMGRMYVYGKNNNGQIGVGNIQEVDYLKEINLTYDGKNQKIIDVCMMGRDKGSTLCITEMGKLYATGVPDYNTLGDDSELLAGNLAFNLVRNVSVLDLEEFDDNGVTRERPVYKTISEDKVEFKKLFPSEYGLLITAVYKDDNDVKHETVFFAGIDKDNCYLGENIPDADAERTLLREIPTIFNRTKFIDSSRSDELEDFFGIDYARVTKTGYVLFSSRDQTFYFYGKNEYNQFGNMQYINVLSSVLQDTSFTLPDETDPKESKDEVVPNLALFDIESGYSIFMTKKKKVYVAGNNNHGQCGFKPSEYETIDKFTVTNDRNMAIEENVRKIMTSNDKSYILTLDNTYQYYNEEENNYVNSAIKSSGEIWFTGKNSPTSRAIGIPTLSDLNSLIEKYNTIKEHRDNFILTRDTLFAKYLGGYSNGEKIYVSKEYEESDYGYGSFYTNEMNNETHLLPDGMLDDFFDYLKEYDKLKEDIDIFVLKFTNDIIEWTKIYPNKPTDYLQYEYYDRIYTLITNFDTAIEYMNNNYDLS